LASASLGRRLTPAERTAVELALGSAALRSAGRGRSPTIPDVVAALLAPEADVARDVGSSAAELRADGRDVGLELRRFVTGDVRGMFDGDTSPGVSTDGQIVVLDLSAVYHSPALGALMTCAAAWLQSSISARGSAKTIVVVDEAWAVLADVAVGRWLQSSWKLSRALGVANVAVLHRPSDLRAAGAEGSEQARLAEGLLADTETFVLYAQPPGEVAAARELLGLGATEEALLPRLGRGVALWRIRGRPYLVRHLLAPEERAIVDTDQRMRREPC
ncbi:MAG TPA: hypothetical protein VGS21_02420, partial [Acidimicrobiales bacterium]|nr:hypothetical protein [Acidimicrobiales bacterium]